MEKTMSGVVAWTIVSAAILFSGTLVTGLVTSHVHKADAAARIAEVKSDSAWGDYQRMLKMSMPPDRSRNGEPFTATTDCPDCGVMAVHWLKQPPTEQEQKKVDLFNAALGRGPLYGELGTVTVVRECVKCGYVWTQK